MYCQGFYAHKTIHLFSRNDFKVKHFYSRLSMLLQELVFKNIVTYIRGSRRKNPLCVFHGWVLGSRVMPFFSWCLGNSLDLTFACSYTPACLAGIVYLKETETFQRKLLKILFQKSRSPKIARNFQKRWKSHTCIACKFLDLCCCVAS